ncbi:MAG TPA: hypothetical protein VFS40_02515 [Gemmatimonadales bacterium]|nr:hypothetical protein [Gemmatimonadales bacterium]
MPRSRGSHRTRLLAAVAAALTLGGLAARPAQAQAGNSECASYSGGAGNICNAAIDGTRYFHPLVGVLISGGNPVLGQAGTLGGLGHFSVTLRANAARVRLPGLDYTGSTNTVPAGDTVFVPAPSIEAAVGLWKGLAGGLLSVDALGSAQLLPTDQIDDFQLDPDATTIGGVGLGFGFGARIGLLRDHLMIPGVSVSIMRRNIPRLQYGRVDVATLGNDYSYAVDLHATNLRVAVSKSLAIVTLAAGAGVDKYTGAATVAFRDPALPLTVHTVDFKLDQTRQMVFANAGFDFKFVKLVGELGYQTGKDQKLTTDFEGIDTKAGTTFGSVGLRVGF